MSRASRSPRAFTLVELLVVVAIIALLISILLPSLARAREQAKKSKCLANLKDIAVASISFSSSESSEILVPMPAKKTVLSGGFNWFWGNELFGGKGGNPQHILSPDTTYKTAWTAFKRFGPGDRPLNAYLYRGNLPDSWYQAQIAGNAYKDWDMEPRLAEHANLDMPVFNCPSDVGLPAARGVLANGADFYTNAQIAPEVRLYDISGNSYSTHWATPLLIDWEAPGGEGFPYRGWGAINRQLSDFPSPSRCVIYREGNAKDVEFYNNLGDTPNENTRIFGWHGEDMTFTASFADGHAGEITHLVRTNATGIDDTGYQVFYGPTYHVRGGRPEAVLLPFNDPFGGVGLASLLFRGDGWQLDCFPSPPNIVIASASEM